MRCSSLIISWNFDNFSHFTSVTLEKFFVLSAIPGLIDCVCVGRPGYESLCIFRSKSNSYFFSTQGPNYNACYILHLHTPESLSLPLCLFATFFFHLIVENDCQANPLTLKLLVSAMRGYKGRNVVLTPPYGKYTPKITWLLYCTSVVPLQ